MPKTLIPERKPSVAPSKKQAASTRNGKASLGKAAHKRPVSRQANPNSLIRTFRGALDYLSSRPDFERRPPTARDKAHFTLSRIRKLLAAMDNPQKSFKSVHIAGTKGKGSTAAMLAHMLQNNGMKVGLYTSPHIRDVRERITINGTMISEAAFIRLMNRLAKIIARDKGSEPPTFFEVLTAVAFEHFRDHGVDVAVVETGLGGRLDATNVLKPEVCGITSISLDHTGLLGNTLEQIAEEKAGIFKDHVPVVSAPQPRNVKQVLRKVAEKTRSQLLFTGEDIEFSYRFESSRSAGPQARICVTTPTSHYDHLPVPLVGEHQAVNCGVALGILDQLKARGFEINDEAAISGLAKVSLEGRMEMLCEKPRVIADCAHNASSIEAVMRAIGQNITYDSMVVIFGCCADKDLDSMLRLIQLGGDKVIFTSIKSPRSADPAELAAKFTELTGRMAQVARALPDAMHIAEKAVTREDLICITGSFFLVSEAKSFFANHPHRPGSTAMEKS